jgi:hypothetical protein
MRVYMSACVCTVFLKKKESWDTQPYFQSDGNICDACDVHVTCHLGMDPARWKNWFNLHAQPVQFFGTN